MSKINVLLLAALLITPAGVAVWYFSGFDSDRTMREARRAMLLNQDAEAIEFATECLRHEPGRNDALLILGQALVNQRRHAEALTILGRIPNDVPEALTARLLTANTLLFEQSAISKAEAQYRQVLQFDPNHTESHNKLAWLLGVSGRASASNQQILKLIELEEFDFVHLAVLILNHDRIREPDTVQQWESASPQDAHVLLARAALQLTEQNYEQVLKIATDVCEQHPEWVDAVVMRGEALLRLGQTSTFADWERSLDSVLQDDVSVLAMRGRMARARGNLPAAAGLLLRSLDLDPTQRQASFEAGMVLQALGRPTDAEGFLEQARLLEEYERVAKTAWNTDGLVHIEECVKLADDLQLDHERYAWSVVALRKNSNSPLVRRCYQQTKQNGGLVASTGRGGRRIQTAPDLNNFLADTTTSTEPLEQPRPLTSAQPSADIQFAEMAQEVGLNFRYRNGGDANAGTRRLLETLGGGVGILDHDMDGDCDVFLPQGGDWPLASDGGHADGLFQNQSGASWHAVADVAGLADSAFSTGASVGDVNNDGFPDLMVGNIGPNHLYHNNGDGTFTVVPGVAEPAPNTWTTSSAIADLNGDTFPDLYVVNYLGGDDVLTRICESSDGVPTSCLPQLFPSAQDQLLLNDGAGGFLDVTGRSSLVKDGGNGLAVIAADFENTGRMGLFVANDVAPNFYFRQSETLPIPEFSEEGMIRGLALNGDAKHEACMGVAAGDVNGDQLLDIFVTNFENESNTLYTQTSGGLFMDGTDSANLNSPSRSMLGFGTVMLDGDSDGDLDILVANGHINNYRQPNRPYQMRPQFFVNDGTGQFAEHSAGPFFDRQQLGRGLATLDWNNDGRMDVVLTDLASDTRLLTNQTRDAGNWLSLKLIGNGCSRDAIGSQLTLTLGNQTVTRQLTAGAYLSSHDSRILVGLGQVTHVPQIEIHWHDGTRQILADVEAKQRLLVRQGVDFVVAAE